MIKIGVFLSLGLLLNSLLFCNIIRENESKYYNVLLSTSTAIEVSSSTVITSNELGLSGVRRIFQKIGSSDGILYYQLGGSTTTILTNGFILTDNEKYNESNYFGNIYFQTTTSTATLHINTITKK